MCFFVFKQKTAYEMRSSDWSSDVCSSDLKAHAPELRLRAPCENGDAVEALLAVPDRAVTGRFDIGGGESLVGALQLLEAGDVRLLLLQIFEEPRQPGADAVHIVGDDLHGGDLAGLVRFVTPKSWCRSRSPTRRWDW